MKENIIKNRLIVFALGFFTGIAILYVWYYIGPRPRSQQFTTMDIQVAGAPRLFGSDPATAQSLLRYINVGDYSAKGARIKWQHHDGVGWTDPLDSWRTPDGNTSERFKDFPKGFQFVTMLTAHSREGVKAYLESNGKLYFVARVEWANENNKAGCLLRYIEIGIHGWGDSPNSKVLYETIGGELPEGLERPDIGTPCPPS